MGEGFGDLFGIAGTAHGAIGAAAPIAAGELAKSADELTGVDTGFTATITLSLRSCTAIPSKAGFPAPS